MFRLKSEWRATQIHGNQLAGMSAYTGHPDLLKYANTQTLSALLTCINILQNLHPVGCLQLVQARVSVWQRSSVVWQVP